MIISWNRPNGSLVGKMNRPIKTLSYKYFVLIGQFWSMSMKMVSESLKFYDHKAR
jgi:hypothetical protein